MLRFLFPELVYKINFYSTIETKVRSFQIKLNVRAIVTNTALHEFGLKDSANCNIYLINCLLLYARFVIYKCKYG